MPKDNESVPLPDWATEPVESNPAAFAPDLMVRCENCLRANPPTRFNCMYCCDVLPRNDSNVVLRQPTLRRLEKWERGYNNILVPAAANPGATTLAEAAGLLRLMPENLMSIVSAGVPLPLARAASLDEASLVRERLQQLGINSRIVPDDENESDAFNLVRVRSMEIDETGIQAYQTRETPPINLLWSDLILVVTGRLLLKRVEFKEQKAKRAENDIIDANEFVTDESVVDLYARGESAPLRIAANNFDFSCLGTNKGLIAADNITRLVQLIRKKAPQAASDDTFNSVRKLLELVWPSEQQSESSGWRRERPGKVSLGSATEVSNQKQFLWYSRLQRFRLSDPQLQINQQSDKPENRDGVS